MILTVLLLSFVTFWACLAAVFGASVPLSIVVGIGAIPVFIALTFVVALARFLREDRVRARRRKERPNSQGGGKYSRAAPKVRHKRARAKAKAAREARKDNRA